MNLHWIGSSRGPGSGGARSLCLWRIRLACQGGQALVMRLPFSATTPSAAAVVATTAGRTVSSPQRGVGTTAQLPIHG